MHSVGDIIHAGITVRGAHIDSEEKARQAAKASLDKWQAGQEADLPPGARFDLLQEKVRRSGAEASVTRYLVVAEG